MRVRKQIKKAKQAKKKGKKEIRHVAKLIAAWVYQEGA